MRFSLPLFPDQASGVARMVDAHYFFLVSITAFFSLLIGILILYFAIRYRRRSHAQLAQPVPDGGTLEIVWSVIPLGIVLVIFGWGAYIYTAAAKPPADAIEMYATAKQWMWKIQHPAGAREINELHIPVSRAVRLRMTSEDVIHSFFVPAFRTKMDVLPGRYTTMWFRPTKVGKYHLFCAEYCGTKHSGMIGWVHVMEPADYEEWLSGGAGQGTLAERGSKLFQDLACVNCHVAKGGGRAPTLEGIFGAAVELESGEKVIVDDAYVRESILTPQAKVVRGYQPVMPTFQGLVTEDQVMQLIEYVKSLAKPQPQTAQPQRKGPAGK